MCNAPEMVASYGEFAAEHRTQHLTAFNRWCAVVGNSLVPVVIVAALTGRAKAAAAIFVLANATLVTGHIVEGNAPRATTDLLQHPIWSVRADVALAVATVKSALG
jgi:hypothetical protein